MSATTPLPRPRAVAYARYSSEQQRAASIDDQLRNYRRRADDEGWSVAREFADRAISGADSSRPQYRDMLSAAELYRRQISLGPDRASPEVTLKACQALRELLGGIRLEPDEQGGLWAAYEVQPAVLVRGAVSSGAG